MNSSSIWHRLSGAVLFTQEAMLDQLYSVFSFHQFTKF